LVAIAVLPPEMDEMNSCGAKGLVKYKMSEWLFCHNVVPIFVNFALLTLVGGGEVCKINTELVGEIPPVMAVSPMLVDAAGTPPAVMPMVKSLTACVPAIISYA